MQAVLSRAAKRFFGVGNLVGEKTKVARCCTFLVRQVCHKCDKSVKMLGMKVCDTDNEQCRKCVRETYRQVYQEECKSV